MQLKRLILPALIGVGLAQADCDYFAPTEKIIEIDSCEVVNPNTVTRLIQFKEQRLKSRVESARAETEKEIQKILESYRGAVLVNHSVKNPIRYFLASKDPNICTKYNKALTLRAKVGSACCDGDPNPPCYLGFKAFITEVID